MASSTRSGDHPEADEEIRLWREDDWWIARDVQVEVTSQGRTRAEALENLDEAVALHEGEIGESIDTPEEEREVLQELGIDPDEVEDAREDHDGLPEFMQ